MELPSSSECGNSEGDQVDSAGSARSSDFMEAPASPRQLPDHCESASPPGSEMDIDTAGEISEEEGGMQLCSSESGMEVASQDPGSDDGMALDESIVSGMRDVVAESWTLRWLPGKNCGEFGAAAHFSAPLVQVILTNLFANLQRLPSFLCKNVLSHLRPKASLPKRNFADMLASWLLGISHSRARRTFNQVRGNGWLPKVDDHASEDEEQMEKDAEAFTRLAPSFGGDVGGQEKLHLWALRIRVSEALAVARTGASDTSYVAAMKRLKKHGLGIGRKYLTRPMVEAVEFLATEALGGIVAARIGGLVPSLGIPCDLALVFDGVSIGARMFSRHESLLLVGCLLMEDTGGGHWETVAHLLAAPSAGQMHKGSEQADLVLQGLADHNAHLTIKVLAARVAIIGADGAGCAAGGEHPSTGAAEKIWRELHPEIPGGVAPQAPVTDWDLFHRVDNATAHAIADTPCAKAIFDVSRALGALFGVGDGRVIYRSAAEAIGEKRFRVPDQGGSRKVVALASTVEHLLKTGRTFHAAFHARIGQSKQVDGCKGRGSQSQKKLMDVARQMSALNFTVFLVGTGDIMRGCIVPLAMSSQEVGGSAQAMKQECLRTMAKLTGAQASLGRLLTWTFVTALLFARLSSEDLQALWGAISRMDARFLRLAPSLYRMLSAREFNGCGLSVDLPPADDIEGFSSRTLAPHCQCASMVARPGTPRRAACTLPQAHCFA